MITKNGRPRTAPVARENLTRLSKRDRRVQRRAELSNADIAAVEAAEMTSNPAHPNRETGAKRAVD